MIAGDGVATEANTLALALIASGSLACTPACHMGAAPSARAGRRRHVLIGAAGCTMRTLPRAAIGYLHHFCRFDGTREHGHCGCDRDMHPIWRHRCFCAAALNPHIRLFVVRIVRERERNSSIETVKMLLNDLRTRVPTLAVRG
ncbi:MAG: hypothetical protein IPO97_10270 [Sphingomonadales bacterium]|nr:hypothetical protein [Sphingomonadales bacterium]